jgi:predicted choloylglycine hydrolase
LLRVFRREDRLPKFVATGQKLLEQAPADYREELQAFTKAAGVEIDEGVLANTIMDTYRGAIGCSSLLVSGEKSATRGPLFGRNLDFPTLGVLDKYGLVTVHRPRGKHAFAAVGLPGVLGCLSGMNDAGLALAVHEVHFSADGATRLNLKAMPYTFCFRRILEECTTVAEAERLLRSVERSSMLNLAVCDRQGGAVLEMTPKSVALRRGEGGVCACTNDFRSKELATWTLCFRYRTLADCAEMKTITVDDVAGKLDAVNQGWLTMQTMIFEPAALRLHVSLGPAPASKQPLRKLDLAPLLGK